MHYGLFLYHKGFYTDSTKPPEIGVADMINAAYASKVSLIDIFESSLLKSLKLEDFIGLIDNSKIHNPKFYFQSNLNLIDDVTAVFPIMEIAKIEQLRLVDSFDFFKKSHIVFRIDDIIANLVDDFKYFNRYYPVPDTLTVVDDISTQSPMTVIITETKNFTDATHYDFRNTFKFRDKISVIDTIKTVNNYHPLTSIMGSIIDRIDSNTAIRIDIGSAHKLIDDYRINVSRITYLVYVDVFNIIESVITQRPQLQHNVLLNDIVSALDNIISNRRTHHLKDTITFDDLVMYNYMNRFTLNEILTANDEIIYKILDTYSLNDTLTINDFLNELAKRVIMTSKISNVKDIMNEVTKAQKAPKRTTVKAQDSYSYEILYKDGVSTYYYDIDGNKLEPYLDSSNSVFTNALTIPVEKYFPLRVEYSNVHNNTPITGKVFNVIEAMLYNSNYNQVIYSAVVGNNIASLTRITKVTYEVHGKSNVFTFIPIADILFGQQMYLYYEFRIENEGRDTTSLEIVLDASALFQNVASLPKLYTTGYQNDIFHIANRLEPTFASQQDFSINKIKEYYDAIQCGDNFYLARYYDVSKSIIDVDSTYEVTFHAEFDMKFLVTLTPNPDLSHFPEEVEDVFNITTDITLEGAGIILTTFKIGIRSKIPGTYYIVLYEDTGSYSESYKIILKVTY
jgi:hypothetical protein